MHFEQDYVSVLSLECLQLYQQQKTHSQVDQHGSVVFFNVWLSGGSPLTGQCRPGLRPLNVAVPNFVIYKASLEYSTFYQLSAGFNLTTCCS